MMAPMDGIGLGEGSARRLDDLLARQWLVVNHIGGFASSTIACLNTRKYHGLLVAAMSPPVRRMVLLSRVEETITCDGWPTHLACNEYPGTIYPQGHQSLRAFSAEPFPRWAYQGQDWAIEKSLQLIHRQNTVVLTYALLAASKPARLELRPLLALRPIHELTYQWNARLYAEEKSPGHHRVPATNRSPEVFFAHDGEFNPAAAAWYFNTIYRQETERGYAGLEDLWSPGTIKWTLHPGQSVHFVCSAEPVELTNALQAAESQSTGFDAPIVPMPARDTDQDLLVRAADQFVLSTGPHGLLSAFPWSAPNVHQALIAMPGILLVRGQFDRAKSMLLGLAAHLQGGLIPSEFPEDGGGPVYDAADTSLWFVNAVWEYLRYSGDENGWSSLLDAVLQIVTTYHLGGASNVGIDPDGLLATQTPGATWMDARIGGGFVTPRLGRPVELNALWHNAARIASELSKHAGQSSRSRELNELASRIATSFNRRFWNESEQCCFDVLGDSEGEETGESGGPRSRKRKADDLAGLNDSSIRPNQLFACGLPFAALRPDRHALVLERVRRDLLTPMGLRTLTPADAAYRGHYVGDTAARDSAIHQGTVHPRLLGIFVSTYLRVQGRSEASRREARGLIEPCLEFMRNRGVGQLPELFDGDAPHHPRGPIASAAAVGEILRCYVEQILDLQPSHLSSDEKTSEWRGAMSPQVAAGAKTARSGGRSDSRISNSKSEISDLRFGI